MKPNMHVRAMQVANPYTLCKKETCSQALAFPPEARHTGWTLAILTAYAHFLAVVDAMQQIACNPKQRFFRSCYIFRNKSLR